MESMHRLRTLITVISFVCCAVSPASAQNSFPSKPITMLVPFGAGGALDLIARVLADGLRNELGQTILVDNKPGASGLLAMRHAASAAPDGYTIILSSESNHILLPLLDSKFPIDVAKEFVPVSLSGQFQHTLIVKKELPVASVKELVEYLRANPGKLSFGSSGVGTQAHIAGEYRTEARPDQTGPSNSTGRNREIPSRPWSVRLAAPSSVRNSERPASSAADCPHKSGRPACFES